MFNVMVKFEGGQWQFLFKDRGDASDVINRIASLPSDDRRAVVIVDDFGTEAAINAGIIHGAVLEDMSKTGEAAIERSMVQARNQARFQSKAQGDTLIRMAQPMVPPGPNGPFMRS